MLFIVDKYVTCVLHTDRDWVEEPIQKNVAVLHRRWISLRWGRKSKFISTHLQITILLKFHLLGDEKVISLFFVFELVSTTHPQIHVLKHYVHGGWKSTFTRIQLRCSIFVDIMGNPLHQQNVHPQQITKHSHYFIPWF